MHYLTTLINHTTREVILRCLFYAFIPGSIFYCASIVTSHLNGFGVIRIIRDHAQQTLHSSFLGFLSNIGVWLWVSSAAICFFAYINDRTSFREKELTFLVGLLSTILAVDDFFMIHDRYVNQELCYATYAVAAIALLIRHYDRIINIDGFAFILAGSLLGLSIGSDSIQFIIPVPYSITQVFEEGCKFTGAAVWLYFCFQVASSSLLPARAHARKPD